MRRLQTRKPPLIMVADSDEDERCMLRAVLKLKGFSVVVAADGEQAIHLATMETPDLLVIDMRLPRVSGQAVVRQIKNLARLRHLPMITISVSTPNGSRKRFLEAAAHLDKPVEFDQLTSLIDHLLPRPSQAA
jgi:CheY-like chemotaxis protein